MTDTAPGRHADAPQEIPRAGWIEILKRVGSEISADHVSVVSAGTAFFGLLALFPAVTALISIAGLIFDPATIQNQIASMTAMLPQNASEIIVGQAQKVAGSGQTGIGLAAIFGILLALYGASAGMRTLMEGMNIAYDETESRGTIKLYIVSLILTVVLTVGLLLALGVSLALPAIVAALRLPSWIETLMQWLSWPILFVFAIFGLNVIYRWGPSREDARWRWISPGAVLATVIWLIGTGLFTIYATNFGSYNQTYGALGGVIILLTWLWLSAFIVLLGAEFNSEMEHQTAKDTTTGPAEPMGDRGAVKADSTAGS
ncbi:MAG: YihY/virulence factor BrkB family protein [Tranquillimonas sp.]|jgi:membrane protein